MGKTIAAALVACVLVACGERQPVYDAGPGDAGIDFGAATCCDAVYSSRGVLLSIKLCVPGPSGVTRTECLTYCSVTPDVTACN